MPKLSIRARLGAAILLLSVLLIVIGTLGVTGMARSNDANRETYENRLASTRLIGDAELSVSRERTTVDRIAFDPTAPTVDKDVATYRMLKGQGMEAWTQYLALPATSTESSLAAVVNAKRSQVQNELDAFADSVKGMDGAAVKLALKKIALANTDYVTASANLKQLQRDEAKARYAGAEAGFRLFRAITAGTAVLGLLAGALTFMSLRRAISGPLDEALRHFDRIAAGDLSQRIEIRSSDEMGALLQGLSQMRDGLATTVNAVRHVSDTIATAAQQIASGNLDLSSRTEQQAASLQETAASMEELTGTVRQNAENASQALTLATSATETAHHGSSAVEGVVATMAEIDQSSARIGDIIAIIEGIAFQTNILALNAAVEAARAGEQGRGFAVVASEVRTLAQRSSAAAKEIKELIETSSGKVQAGGTLVNEAGGRMQAILTSVKRVADIMGEISAASSEQSSGIEQVAHAVAQMDTATQQNATLVEQAAAAAQLLEQQARQLKETVAVFRL
ncbi:methyl-accepting chemotaxis protein [Paraburkholderia xenovorans]|uniref:methyl-accepting chemotaxis protein n=1 Tax=Paraburkholderia xenovorans TaxID=36873 RepID=UPI0038BDC465